MRSIITSVLWLVGLGVVLSAQPHKIQLLTHEVLGIAYEIPSDWFVGGYLPPETCRCPGGTINTSLQGEVNMVLFSNHQLTMQSLQATAVWGYHFVVPADPSLKQEIQTSKGLQVQREQSHWKEDPSLHVWRLSFMIDNRPFVLYFWGSQSAMESYSPIIEATIQSIDDARNVRIHFKSGR